VDWPPAVRQFSQLITLDLSYNQIQSIPSEVDRLYKLKVLDLSHNQLQELPEEISKLKGLRILNLIGNPIAPEQIEQIKAWLPETEVLF